jgi:hypothetical protein
MYFAVTLSWPTGRCVVVKTAVANFTVFACQGSARLGLTKTLIKFRLRRYSALWVPGRTSGIL